MEQSIATTTPREGWTLTLSSALTGRRVAWLVLAALVLLAVGSRFWDLGVRALHHDESLHAVYSFYLFDRGEYHHDPLMHGPILFHLTALGYWLFGASDATARLVPAILGVLLVWAPWKFRPWLGTKGALVTSALVLISPTLLYYSRFIRHDIFLAAWTVLIVYGMWQYLRAGEDFHLYLMVAGWALAFSQKEVSFILAMVFWAFLALALAYHLWRGRARLPLVEMREWHLLVVIGALLLPFTAALLLHLSGNDPPGGYNLGTYQTLGFVRQALGLSLVLFALGALAASVLWNGRKFLIAAGIFYGIFILFHTTFLTWPYGLGSGLVGALGYWLEQHDVARGEQPWYYYSMLVPLYEFLPLLVGGIGTVALLARRQHGRVLPDKEAHLNSIALWPLFNLWWFAALFVALSTAGEKMPWLLVHLALPLAFLGGWVLGRVLDGVEWARVASRSGAAFGLLFGIALLAFGTLAWLALRSEWPFGGTDEAALLRSARWLSALVLLAGASWGAIRLRDRLGPRVARQIALLTLSGLMALATVRFAVIAAFENADVPNEPLIYTQTSPNVPMLMRQIEAISERMTGGKNLRVAYDSSTSWPFEWYLRDYPNRFFYGSNPDGFADTLRDAPIVLVGPENGNNQTVERLLPEHIRHHYSMRPNFPEDYKNLLQVRTWQPDIANPDQMVPVATGQRSSSPLNLLRNLWPLVQQTQARRDFLDFLVHRRITKPLGDYAMWVYVKPEVANEVWEYGVNVTAMDPDLVRDPFAEVLVPLAPDATIEGLTDPRDVAVLPDGTLAVADAGAHQVRLVAPTGETLAALGGFGEAPGQFNEPWGIAAAPDGTLYVADTWNHRVQHLDTDGTVLHAWGTYAEGGFDAPGGTFWGPRDVAVDAEGRVYVADTGNKRVQRFDAEGNFIDRVGGPGGAAGQLEEPVGVAVAPDGTIWVADTWNRRVQGFNADWTPLQQWSVRAWSGTSNTNKPYIAASDDRVWISDPEGYRVIEMDRQGEPLRVWGPFGDPGTPLDLPYGLTLAEDGRLWLADSGHGRVVGYDVE